MSFTPEQIIAKYISLREQKEKMEDRHKLELLPIRDAINTLENVLGAMIAQLPEKTKNIKTEVGTAFQKKITSITTLDLAAFTNFAIDNDPQMLHIKPSDTGVIGYIERETKQQSKLSEGERKPIVIPGIKIEYIYKVQVRKA